MCRNFIVKRHVDDFEVASWGFSLKVSSPLEMSSSLKNVVTTVERFAVRGFYMSGSEFRSENKGMVLQHQGLLCKYPRGNSLMATALSTSVDMVRLQD